ncbi:MAG: nucleotidyltransferase domain-containing protein [Candidatus Micrarchaeaceae archaeon]
MDSYAKLARIREALRKKSGLKLSFRDVILELINERLESAQIDDRLRRFIERVVAALAAIEGIEGVLLFGSVAKGTYNEYSDIDLLVVVKHKNRKTIEKIFSAVSSLDEESKELMNLGLPSLVSPIILDEDEIKVFRPFYFDLADYGLVLYERGRVLSDFIRSMKWTTHRREVVNGVEVVTW